jgi:hypothetical protein
MSRISPGLTLADVTPLREVKLPFPLSSTTQVACVVVVEDDEVKEALSSLIKSSHKPFIAIEVVPLGRGRRRRRPARVVRTDCGAASSWWW